MYRYISKSLLHTSICLYILHTLILCIVANLLRYRKTSVVMELDQLLSHVKEKFSEILLPAESVTKLEILGKGT